jgi:nitroreductase
MNTIEAMNSRRSTRAFLPKAVERDILEAIFEAAARTPSWADSQPWEVFVAAGETLQRIKDGYQQKYAEQTAGAPETPRPTKWTQEALERQKQLSPDMVRDCGDSVKQFGALNQAMFHAPAVIYICMDKVLSEWSLYDIGAYSQSIMLAAVDYGLATMPAITLVMYPDILRRELKIPENLKLTIGIAIGYAVTENKINSFKSGRRSVGETVRYVD